LHLGIFEQSEKNDFFSKLLDFSGLDAGVRLISFTLADECANFWPGRRSAWALVRYHALCPWGSQVDLEPFFSQIFFDFPDA